MPARPFAGQHHGGKMATRRMPGDVDMLRIGAILAGVQVTPGNRRQDIAHLVLHRNARDETIVDDCDGGTGPGESGSDIREIGFVERAPISAMDEHQQRRAALTRPSRRKNIQRLPRQVAPGDVQEARLRLPGGAGIRGPARDECGVLGDHGARVVLLVAIVLVVGHGRPLG